MLGRPTTNLPSRRLNRSNALPAGLFVGITRDDPAYLYVQHIRVGHPRAETMPPRRDSVLQNLTWTA